MNYTFNKLLHYADWKTYDKQDQIITEPQNILHSQHVCLLKSMESEAYFISIL